MRVVPEKSDAPESIIANVSLFCDMIAKPKDLIALLREKYYPLISVEPGENGFTITPGETLKGSVWVSYD